MLVGAASTSGFCGVARRHGIANALKAIMFQMIKFYKLLRIEIGVGVGVCMCIGLCIGKGIGVEGRLEGR